MEEPEQILKRIMNFEKQYTPQFNDLIKQSLSDNISNASFDIDDDPENDPLPQLPDSSVSATAIKSTSPPLSSYFNQSTSPNHNKPNLETQIISSSQPTPNAMPSWNNNNRRKKSNHRHKETPIMQRAGSSQNSIKLIDQNSFIITDDLQYNSEEDSDDDHFITKPTQNADDQHNDDEEDDGDGSVRRYSSDESEEDEFEEDKPLDPLIEEYEQVSHEIHRSKLKLRKLDRQMTVAQRQGTSQSDFVKQHSDIKIKIAQLISKRRELESHDIVRAHIKEEDTPTVEIGGSGGLNAVMDNDKQSFMEDGGLMEINEDKEEEDEVPEIVHNNISPQGRDMSDSDGNYDEDRLKGFLTGINGYNENEQSKTIDSSMSNEMDHFDYSYDAEVNMVKEMDEDYEETGSVKFHSDEDEDGGGSVQYHSSPEDEEEESDGGGSMQMNPDVDNRENWVDEEDENGGYEDEDESGGGGSVQMNDVENNENWVDEEFDNKSIEIRASDDEDDHENNGDMKHIEDVKDAKDEDSKDEEKKDKLDEEEEEKHEMNLNSVRRRRLEQMKRHRNYKEYGGHADDEENDDLDQLRAKYQESRRQREQIEIDGPFSVNLLTKAENGYDAVTDLTRFGNQIPRIVDDDEDKNDVEYDQEDDEEFLDDDYPIPVLPGKKKSVLLDIEQLAGNLAAVIEEDDDEDDSEERNFQTVEYQTDSDCDSNDSVVVKKEIYKNVTVNDLQQFDTV